MMSKRSFRHLFRETVLLREFIRLIIAERNVDKPYDHDLCDDDVYNSESTYVPDDIKTQITKWMGDMGLRRSKRRKRR